MRMISKYKLLLYFLTGMAIYFTAGCDSPEKRGLNDVVYTCPMHPEIRKDEPGKCPICKMDLVPVHTENKQKDSLYIEKLLDPTNQYVVSDIESIKPSRSIQQYNKEVHGVISYDERLVNSVAARVDGRIEKLYVKYRYQNISMGQRLFDLYSPELQNEQQNFLFLLKNEKGLTGIIKSAKTKLSLMGLTDAQISQIETTSAVINPLPYYSPYSGHLHVPGENPSGSDMNTMSGVTNPTSANNSVVLKEGMYVKKGQIAFQIFSTNKVWGILNLSLKEASSIRVGDSVVIRSKSEFIPAKIDFIEPTLKDGQSFVRVRVYIENRNNQLKIGENITAEIRPTSSTSLFLPSTSVVSLGLRKVVFIRIGNRYKAQVVQTGVRTAEFIEVIGGLDSTSLVAKNASFLIDSESFVNPNE